MGAGVLAVFRGCLRVALGLGPSGDSARRLSCPRGARAASGRRAARSFSCIRLPGPAAATAWNLGSQVQAPRDCRAGDCRGARGRADCGPQPSLASLVARGSLALCAALPRVSASERRQDGGGEGGAGSGKPCASFQNRDSQSLGLGRR